MRSNHLSCNANWRLTFLKTLYNSFFFQKIIMIVCNEKEHSITNQLCNFLGGGFKVTLHGTIRNDDFQRNPALQCWDNVVTIRNNVATMLNAVLGKKCRYESFRVTSPLGMSKIKHGILFKRQRDLLRMNKGTI